MCNVRKIVILQNEVFLSFFVAQQKKNTLTVELHIGILFILNPVDGRDVQCAETKSG